MKNADRGFTVVELLMTMLAGSIIALTAGLMLLISYRTWKSNNEYVDLQRQVTMAQTVADRWVREAAYWEVSATNAQLLIVSGGRVRRLARVDAALVYDPDTAVAGDELVIGSNTVDAFLVNVTPLGVKLDLKLSDNGMSAQMHTFLSYRN